ncbi:NAD(P)-binding protein [Ramicandelaber brevisporus]|nr:NAD(P)-binding protein [Ramicandelaber brevisporus]
MHIQGKVAVVTGAAMGFGAALAERLISKGARVVLGDIAVEAGQRTAADFNARYGNGSTVAVFQRCDVANLDQLKALIQAAYDNFGDLDIIANNAGIANDGGFLQPDDQRDATAVARMININLTAAIEGTGLAIRHWLHHSTGEKKDRCVINTASIAGIVPLSKAPVYSATKAGLVHFTASLQPYAESDKIRVNAVCPWFSKTPLLEAEMTKSPLFKQYVESQGFVSIERVVDAMIQCVEDEKLAGEALCVVPDKVNQGGKIYPENSRPKVML